MNLDPGRERWIGAAEGADQLLHAGVDVGAVESRDAGFDEHGHVLDGLLRIDRAVVAGEMPASFDDPGEGVAVGKGIARYHRESCVGRGTAVVSDRLKYRRAVRVIRNRVGQFGSGQATSASEVIQSFGSVTRCLAGNRGSR